MTLDLDFPTIVGLVGSGLMMVAFAYSNLATVVNLVLFNLLNLIGAILLGWSLTIHFNMASLVLEIVWAAIALFGLIKALVLRSRA
ncbi:CBU_0592 family membrane protein [Sphingomonas sp.]|uniref:CBU_0592 family membrane protein n=1 Tax=Sphingomonas sp. TaxID=28214 RepID=UPI003B3B487C